MSLFHTLQICASAQYEYEFEREKNLPHPPDTDTSSTTGCPDDGRAEIESIKEIIKERERTKMENDEEGGEAASTRQSPRKKAMVQDNYMALLIGAVNAVEGTNPMNPLNQPRLVEQAEVPQDPVPEPEPLPVAAPQKEKAAATKKSPPAKRSSPQPKKEKQTAASKKEEKLVATNEPPSPTPSKAPQKPKKLSLKALQSQEKICLDTLTELPAKMLRELFSEKMPQQNQYSDKFNFVCLFHTDGRCKHEFKGFRDERTVHKDIQEHIQEHIKLETTKGTDFHTCSVQYRRKQKVLESKKKKQTTVAQTKKRKPTSKSSSPEPEALIDQVSNNSNDSKKSTSKKRKSPDNKENLCNSPEAQNCVKMERPPKRPRSINSESSVEELIQELNDMNEADICFENLIYDHTYAAPPGGKPKQGRPASPSGSESDESSLSSGVSFEEGGSRASSPGMDGSAQFGMDGLPVAHEETIFSTSIENIDSKGGVVKKEAGNNTTTVRRRQAPRRKVTPIPQETKDLAQKYIRELQNKKKEDDFKLICKICNDGKVFTAGATLQNHYKSHAGMKPFSCHKCPQTFTRKHSLKYHLLIHLGKSRFTCEWCARQFRHPSHFKEHKRKHTGETPYECTDCLVKYKTRNTYKRHLRTHHGKVLSSKGVYIMTEEEFAKVRTKKYKKSVKSNCSSPEPETSSPVPSTPSTPSPVPEDQKRPRKITRKPRATATKPTATTPSRRSQSQSMTLPPVSTILPPFATHGQAGTPVNPHSIVHVNPQQVLGTVSQASVGVMPPMGSVRSGTPVGVLGMAMMGHGMVLPTCTASLTTPTPVTLMRPAAFNMAQPAITIPQPTVTMATNIQGQTYYTITAFSPVVPVDNAQPIYNARPVVADVSHTPEVDMADYKPVGYITHN